MYVYCLDPAVSYRDQLEMLSESMVEEKANLTLREKAQKKVQYLLIVFW